MLVTHLGSLATRAADKRKEKYHTVCIISTIYSDIFIGKPFI
jgi:hypothetical protein